MPEPAIHLEGLTKVYASKAGPTTAVENLTLTIGTGEIFGLLGPNGAGKTTTVRILCGLIAPTRGSAFVDGLSVRQNPDAVRSRLGLVPEDAGDHKNLTLREELEYHGALYGLDGAAVRQRSGPLIERLGLQDRTNHRLNTFSRGMRRKFHLIRALLHRPRVLLLDEPTAGLDPSVVEEVWDILKLLATEHVTIVLCSHHLEEVERLCSRVAILRRTFLIEGSLAELSGGDRRYRLELQGQAAPLVETVQQIAGIAEVKAEDRVLMFRLAGSDEAPVPEIVRAVVARGGEVLTLTRAGRDLRSLYRSCVGSGPTTPNGE